MAASITGSVGRNGKNLPTDVKTVQTLLNKHRPIPMRMIAEDSTVTPDTIDAIVEFQRRVVKMSSPDGRVDPNGGTLKALNAAPTGWGTAPPAPAVGAVAIAVRHGGKKPTGVTGLAGASDKTTATRYESSLTVSGPVTGTFRASIYPDNMDVKGRANDGTYDVYLGFHKAGTPEAKDLVVRTNGFRAVLIVNANGKVPVTSNLATKTTSEGIHIHNGYRTWKAETPMSEGCIILHPDDWEKFLKLFLDKWPSLADWTAGGGRLGKKIGTVTVSP